MEQNESSPLKAYYTVASRIEPYAIGLVTFILLLKISNIHLPGANIFFILGAGTLSIINLIRATTISTLDQLSKSIKLVVTLGLYGTAILVIGMLFKLLFWPSPFLLLLIGIILLAISIYGIYAQKDNGEENPYFNFQQLLYRFIGFFVIGLFLITVSDKSLFRMVYADDKKRIKLYELMVDHPDNQAYKKSYHKYIQSKNKKR